MVEMRTCSIFQVTVLVVNFNALVVVFVNRWRECSMFLHSNIARTATISHLATCAFIIYFHRPNTPYLQRTTKPTFSQLLLLAFL